MGITAFRTAGTKPLLVAIVATILACAGPDGAPGADGMGVLLRSATEAPGAECATGGVRVESGVDANRDGQLADAEVQSTVYVCDGADGQSAQVAAEQPGSSCPEGGVAVTTGSAAPTYVCNGAPGAIGQDGQSVAMTPEPAGASCTYGGQRLQVGAGTPTYVCDGAPGAAGQDGLSVTMTPEPPGANCVFGGVVLQVGGGPVSYLCSGAPVGVTLPVVQTVDVTGIRYVDAVVSGVVTDSGGELVIARGAVLATHSDPSLRDTIVFSGGGVGAFATACPDLAPATTYWVRAFATNALGTSYGDVLSFTTKALTVPTLSTQPVSNVTTTTAISGGDIGDDGGTEILGRGICWSLAADPTVADACASEGVGAGSFIALASGLTASTTYHLRAYATNAQGTSYGDDRSFTTAALPLATVISATPSAVSYTTANGGGNVTADNGAAVTSRGICWGTSPSPTTAGAKYVEAGGLGAFTAPMTGLAANTTYYVRAFAVNAAGTSYGNDVSFTTPVPTIPSLTTTAVSGISSDIAGSGGAISTDGGSPITAKGVCWSLNPNPTIADSKTTDGTGTASYNSTMTGLTKLTTYHVRAYATNGLGTAYGSDLVFTTTDLVSPGPSVPIVGTSTAALTSGSTASSGGYVSSNGGSAVTARGVCWSTSANPTLADTCSGDGTGVGFFTSTITGLSGCGVVYYVRAYATNVTGTGYGNQTTVSTGLLPTVTTTPATGIGYYDASSGGTITDNGGCAITQKGVVWSWNPSPTLGNPSTNDGTGDAAYASAITGLQANRTYYVRAYATNSVGTTYGGQEVFTTAEPAELYLGMNYAGGIVFYIDGTGQHGLVIAPTQQGGYGWGCQGTNVLTGKALGTGAANTAAIVASCGVGTAAWIVDGLVLNGYDDWFLPSVDELKLVESNLWATGYPGIGWYYWSSSQANPSDAYYVYFQYGANTTSKGGGLPVRAVRAF